ncbi:hypothetical protein CsatA_014858 [Cannabis sativa]
MQGLPVNIIVGSHVWVGDPELVWVDGHVLNIDGEEAEIQTTNGKKVVAKVSKLYPKDMETPKDGVDDMTKLSYLHEPGVLHNLATRYEMNEIYTYTGNILIAINPFQSLSNLYDACMMELYKGAPFGKLGPHVFAIADFAYRQMINEGKSNSILVSGESGAGKTETTKMLMRYLAFVGGRSASEGRTVEQQVLESNPVLEAFGNAKTSRNNNSSDAHDYLTTKRAMEIVGISEKEQDAIFKVVAAILHLGNIEFAKGEDNDSSVVKNEMSLFHLQMTAELLMCNPNALEDALCKRIMITPEEVIKRSLDPIGATVSRDGLAKTIYSRLFDWLVDKINDSIGQDPYSNCLIGVLDIYGFESFKNNSFEQFCINFTNEKLQQHFNQHVFKMEQEEYIKEQINWSYIGYVDNQDVLDLIEKKPGGIIALLDEACMFPKSTYETFAQKLYQTYKDHKRFVKPKLARSDFSLLHYAGEVQYQSDQFLDKNKYYVVPEHQDLLSSSRCSFVSGLFPSLSDESAKSSKFSSIGSRFKGVLEAVRIKCSGYPTYRTFFEFLSRFGILAPEVLKGNCDEKVACEQILEKMGLTGYQIGKTKVFLRAGQMAELDARRTEILGNSAKIIQLQVRTRIARRRFLSMQKASIDLQSFWRGEFAYRGFFFVGNVRMDSKTVLFIGKMARNSYKTKKREVAAVKIQKNLRRTLARKDYKQIKSSAIVLQTGLRAMVSRDEFRSRRQSNAAIVLQASWRRYKAFSDYRNLRRASAISQCRWRGRIANRNNNKQDMIDDMKEEKEEQPTEVHRLLQFNPSKGEESDLMLDCQVAQLEMESSDPSVEEPSSLEDARRVGILTAEVKNLKAMLNAERRRADDYELKYREAHENSEEMFRKLEESERTVDKLQDSLNRMIRSMSNQFSELKSILRTASKSCSNSGLTIRHNEVEASSSSSEYSFIDPDFTFPVTSSTSVPNSGQLFVQDISSDVSGSESDKEGAFDDYF